MHFPVNVLVNKTKVQDGYKTYRVEDFIFIILHNLVQKTGVKVSFVNSPSRSRGTHIPP